MAGQQKRLWAVVVAAAAVMGAALWLSYAHIQPRNLTTNEDAGPANGATIELRMRGGQGEGFSNSATLGPRAERVALNADAAGARNNDGNQAVQAAAGVRIQVTSAIDVPLESVSVLDKTNDTWKAYALEEPQSLYVEKDKLPTLVSAIGHQSVQIDEGATSVVLPACAVVVLNRDGCESCTIIRAEFMPLFRSAPDLRAKAEEAANWVHTNSSSFLLLSPDIHQGAFGEGTPAELLVEFTCGWTLRASWSIRATSIQTIRLAALLPCPATELVDLNVILSGSEGVATDGLRGRLTCNYSDDSVVEQEGGIHQAIPGWGSVQADRLFAPRSAQVVDGRLVFRAVPIGSQVAITLEDTVNSGLYGKWSGRVLQQGVVYLDVLSGPVLTGVLVDASSGEPVSRAKIEFVFGVIGEKGGRWRWNQGHEITTVNHGQFAISPVGTVPTSAAAAFPVPRQCRIIVSAVGYQPWESELSLQGAEHRLQEIGLLRDPCALRLQCCGELPVDIYLAICDTLDGDQHRRQDERVVVSAFASGDSAILELESNGQRDCDAVDINEVLFALRAGGAVGATREGAGLRMHCSRRIVIELQLGSIVPGEGAGILDIIWRGKSVTLARVDSADSARLLKWSVPVPTDDIDIRIAKINGFEALTPLPAGQNYIRLRW